MAHRVTKRLIRDKRDLPDDPDLFNAEYNEARKRIFARLSRSEKGGVPYSVRQAAKDIGTSHMTIQRMRKDPSYVPAYRTKAKFIRAFVAPRPKTKRHSPRVISNHEYIMVCAK